MHIRSVVTVLFLTHLAFAEQNAPRSLTEELSGAALASFEQAKDLFEHADFSTAHAKFKAAYQSSKNARLLWNMAACSTKLKRYASAIGEAERYLREGKGTLSGEQEGRANAFLADMRTYVAEATLTVQPAGSALHVDRESRGVIQDSTTMYLDVGSHDVQVEKAGFEPLRETFVVREVGAVTFRFALKPVAVGSPVMVASPVSAVTPAVRVVAAAVEPPPAASNGYRTAGWTSVGLGLAALGGGAFMHLQARSAGSDFLAKCQESVCDASASTLHDDAQSKATMASLLYAGAGVLSVVGAVLLWTNPASEESAPKALHLQIGAASVAVGGAF